MRQNLRGRRLGGTACDRNKFRPFGVSSTRASGNPKIAQRACSDIFKQIDNNSSFGNLIKYTQRSDTKKFGGASANHFRLGHGQGLRAELK